MKNLLKLALLFLTLTITGQEIGDKVVLPSGQPQIYNGYNWVIDWNALSSESTTSIGNQGLSAYEVCQKFEDAFYGKAPLNLIMSGDSTFHNNYSEGFPYFFNQLAKIGVTVFNNALAGQSGENWGQDVDPTGTGRGVISQALPQISGTGSNSIMLYNFGINDRKTSETEFKDNQRFSINTILAEKPDLTFYIIIPIDPATNSRIWMRELADELSLPYIDVNELMDAVRGVSADNYGNYYHDATHPNPIGTRRYVNAIIDRLVPKVFLSKITLEEFTAEGYTGTIENPVILNVEQTNMGSPLLQSAVMGSAPVNNAPTASNDVFTIPVSVPYDIDVLANDSDLDADALTIIEIDGTPIVSGNSVTLTDGTIVTLNTDSTLNINPVDGALEVINLVYVVSDGNGGESESSVVVNIQEPTAPSGNLIQTESFKDGSDNTGSRFEGVSTEVVDLVEYEVGESYTLSFEGRSSISGKQVIVRDEQNGTNGIFQVRILSESYTEYEYVFTATSASDRVRWQPFSNQGDYEFQIRNVSVTKN